MNEFPHIKIQTFIFQHLKRPNAKFLDQVGTYFIYSNIIKERNQTELFSGLLCSTKSTYKNKWKKFIYDLMVNVIV